MNKHNEVRMILIYPCSLSSSLLWFLQHIFKIKQKNRIWTKGENILRITTQMAMKESVWIQQEQAILLRIF